MWCSAYDGVEETPEGYWITDVEGDIPSQLTGTYFRYLVLHQINVFMNSVLQEWSR